MCIWSQLIIVWWGKNLRPGRKPIYKQTLAFSCMTQIRCITQPHSVERLSWWRAEPLNRQGPLDQFDHKRSPLGTHLPSISVCWRHLCSNNTLRGIITHAREGSFKGKNLLLLKQILPFPGRSCFWKGLVHIKAKRKLPKLSPFEIMEENLPSITIPLIKSAKFSREWNTKRVSTWSKLGQNKI